MGGKNRERLQLLSKGLQGGSISKSLRSKFFILFSCSPNFQETSLSLSSFSPSVLHCFIVPLSSFRRSSRKRQHSSSAFPLNSQLSVLIFFFFLLPFCIFIHLKKKKKNEDPRFVIVASNNPATDLVRGSWWSYWKSGQ